MYTVSPEFDQGDDPQTGDFLDQKGAILYVD